MILRETPWKKEVNINSGITKKKTSATHALLSMREPTNWDISDSLLLTVSCKQYIWTVCYCFAIHPTTQARKKRFQGQTKFFFL